MSSPLHSNTVHLPGIWNNANYITAILNKSGLANTLQQMCTYTLSPNAEYVGGTVHGFIAFDLIPLNPEDSKIYLYVKYDPGRESFLKEIWAEYVKNNNRRPPNDEAVILYAIFLAFKTFKKYIDEKYISKTTKQATIFDELKWWGDTWLRSLTKNDGTIINYCGGYCGGDNFLAIIGY